MFNEKKYRSITVCGAVFLFLITNVLNLVNASDENDYLWINLQYDSGVSAPLAFRGQVTSPSNILRKEFIIDFDPAEVKKALLEYEMKSDPYHAPAKRSYSKPEQGLKWGEMVIFVNGKEAVKKPLIDLATKGWHTVEIEPSLLTMGKNTIDMSVAGTPRGYFYLGVDNTEVSEKSYASRDGGKTFTADTLNPQHLDSENPSKMAEGRSRTTGEYMVRLRLGL